MYCWAGSCPSMALLTNYCLGNYHPRITRTLFRAVTEYEPLLTLRFHSPASRAPGPVWPFAPYESGKSVHVRRYGVNAGSALAIIGNSSIAGTAAVNTTISAACATLSALGLLMYLSYKETGHGVWDLIGAANGTLGGLVAITAGARIAPYHLRFDCAA